MKTPAFISLTNIRRSATMRLVHKQQGLSLIELMISLLISTLILFGLVRIFSMNRVTYQSDEGLARLQENARFAIEFLGREIRNVGNMGCFAMPSPSGSGGAQDREDKVAYFIAGPTITRFSDYPISQTYDMQQSLRGFDATAVSNGGAYTMLNLYPPAVTTTTDPGIPGALTPAAIVTGSDALIARSLDQDIVPLYTPYNDANAVYIKNPNNIRRGDVVIASDCKEVAIFQVTGVTDNGGYTALAHDAGGSPGNTCPTWGTPGCRFPKFEEGAELGVIRTAIYYVGRGTNGGPSLFRNNFSSGSTVPEELVEGVENLQFLYNDGTQYLEARNVVNWPSIVSVRIGMLVATSNVVTAADTSGSNVRGGADTSNDTSQYTMQNITLTPPPDQRRRRAFETTVQVRNKL